MNRLSKVLLIAVLVSVVGVPVLAAPPDAYQYESKSLSISDYYSGFDMYAYDEEYLGGTYSSLYIWSLDLSCYFNPLPIDIPNMKGASPFKWEFAVPIGTNCSVNNTGLSEIVVDLTLTPNNVTHGNHHSNVIVGDYQSQKCQNWQKYGNEVSGTINGEPFELGEYGQFWGSDNVCTYK